jgi:hypothetical protein
MPSIKTEMRMTIGAEIAKRGTRNKSAEILESQFGRPQKHSADVLNIR